MDKESSEMDWSQLEKPLPSNLFDKYTHQSLIPPLDCLNIDEITWKQSRTFALHLAQRGFLDPLAILYTSFKRLYPNCPSIRSFSRWLNLHEQNREDFKDYFKQYSVHSMNIQSTGELIRLVENLQIEREIPPSIETYDQIWFLFSISIRIPLNDYALIADTLILDDGVTRFSAKHRKTTNSSRIHCLVALTPSGKFSNQLILCKQTKHLKINFPSSTFTHIIQTTTGDIYPEHIQQWFEDFLSLSYAKNHSAILIDPRTTLLTPEIESLCLKSNVDLITLDLNTYLIQILAPILSLFDKQCSEANRLDKMFLKSACDLKRIIFTIWCSLRTLKQNEQIYQIFQQTKFWKNEDELYRQSLRTNLPPTILSRRKKKKPPVKIDNKTKLSSTPVLNDIPNESTPEQIFSFILQRQISIARASKFLGGTKLDYIKYCLSYKSSSSLMTGAGLVQLNAFMQSQATIDWLRYLRSVYFWPCAKQLFLREIYHLTGVITRKRSTHMCGNGNIGSVRSCDLQSPGIFWKAFEDIHQIEFDNESTIDDEQWHDDFQQYLIDTKLNDNKTQLWTIDTFEFPLTKKSTVLQLPEWNELRPMNLTPKVTVIYAFSNTGQSIAPCFIFPKSFHSNEDDFFNDLGHFTPEIFLSYCEKYLSKQSPNPLVLIFCSRLPILSSEICSKLRSTFRIYPYGYPFSRTLPFRYLFERRVRNNRSTNLISELWKKKLLDEQRTHVLKDSNCTMENIKHYFEEVWKQISDENQPFEEKCQQAFQQASIEIKSFKKKIKLISKRNSKKIQEQEMVQQLNQLLHLIAQVKEQITSGNVSQILKMNNHLEQTTDAQISPNNDEPTDDPDLNDRSSASPPPSESDSPPSTNDKRSLDENDQPNLSKRLRTTDSHVQWTPPSKECILHLQNQSSSLLQFTLALVNLILSSFTSDCQLTAEHSHWLHTTMNFYGHNYNREKITLLIETACKIAKLNLVR